MEYYGKLSTWNQQAKCAMVKSPCQTKKLSFVDHLPRETYKYPYQYIYIYTYTHTYIYMCMYIHIYQVTVGSSPLPTLKPPLRPFQLPGHANSRHLRTQYSKGCGANSLVPSRAIDPFPPGGVKNGQHVNQSFQWKHDSNRIISLSNDIRIYIYIYNYIII